MSNQTPQHRGRIQAQGGGTEKSVAWSQDLPPTESVMLQFVDALEAQLSKTELKDRAIPLRKLRQFIQAAAASGGVGAVSKHWYKPGSDDIRVDLEVIDGQACVPDP